MILPAIFLPSPVDSWFIGTDFWRSDTSSGRVTRREWHIISQDLSISRKSFNEKVSFGTFWLGKLLQIKMIHESCKRLSIFRKSLKTFSRQRLNDQTFLRRFHLTFASNATSTPAHLIYSTPWKSWWRHFEVAGLWMLILFRGDAGKKFQNPCWTHKDD